MPILDYAKLIKVKAYSEGIYSNQDMLVLNKVLLQFSWRRGSKDSRGKD